MNSLIENMAMAFHSALTDAPLGSEELKETVKGIEAALAVLSGQEPVGEVTLSGTGPDSNGLYIHEFLSSDRIPVGAELFVQPVAPEKWRKVSAGLPKQYEVVRVKLESGLTRVGRLSAHGYWQFAEFFHKDYKRNKYPPISQLNDPVVAWMRIGEE